MGDRCLVFPEPIDSEQNRVFSLVKLGIDMVETEEEEEEGNGFQKKEKRKRRKRCRHMEKLIRRFSAMADLLLLVFHVVEILQVKCECKTKLHSRSLSFASKFRLLNSYKTIPTYFIYYFIFHFHFQVFIFI